MFADSATLSGRHFTVESLLVVTAASKTLTLPTPTRALAGKASYVVNYSTGTLTLSGAFVGGSSFSVDTKQTVLLVTLPVAARTYKWAAIGIGAASTEEIISDMVGLMVTGNTETGITVTYQDGDNTLDFALGEHIHTGAADGGLLTQLALSDATATPGASKIVVSTAGNVVDGWISTATAATPGLVEHADWAAWTPTYTWSIAPATPVVVARHQHVGNMVTFYCDWATADGNDGILTAVTLPHAPVDVNVFIPLTAHWLVDTTYADPYAYIDATTSTYPIAFHSTVTATDTKACRLIMTGSYEVAAT